MAKTKIYYILIFLLFAVFVFFETLKPKPIDWTYNFTSNGKMPHGCYALYKLLPQLSFENSVANNFDNFYAWKDSYYLQSGKSLIIITGNFKIDTVEFSMLCKHVSAGNKVFIAAEDFNKVFEDSLKIKTDFTYQKAFSKTKCKISFKEPSLDIEKKYSFPTNGYSYFSRFDSSNSVLLASDSAQHAVFIKVPMGSGAFYLSSTPLLYTNYNILYINSEYALKCLSYVAGNSIIWDEYYKPDNAVNVKSSSPLRYILSNAGLATAYYLLLFTAILFMIFDGRRRQRIIPDYKKPVNQSLDFTRTVAMLFFNQKKYKNLADKRIIYFYDYVYTKFKVRFDETDSTCINQLVEKSTAPETLINRIFNSIVWIKLQKEISEYEALDFIDITNRFISICNEK